MTPCDALQRLGLGFRVKDWMGDLGLDLLNAKLEFFCRLWIDNLAPAYKDINSWQIRNSCT